jgi:hypothetical protein
MRLVLVFVLATMTACVSGEPARRHRWPGHREEKDAQIADLLLRVENLEKELAQTKAAVAKLQNLPQSAGATPTDAR